MKETKKLKDVIPKFQKKGYVLWQGDDGPKAYKVLGKLIKMTFEGGGRVIHLRSGGSQDMVDGSPLLSGKFLAIREL